MWCLEILRGTEKAPALQFNNLMFPNLKRDLLAGRPFICSISHLSQPQDVFAMQGFTDRWAEVPDITVRNDFVRAIRTLINSFSTSLSLAS